MAGNAIRIGVLPVLFLAASAAGATILVDTDHADDWKQRQAALFDALRADGSPRTQVLAGRVHLSTDEDAPTVLRPKPEDVVARAARLAPDDAFVQWMAADQAYYGRSQCGPVQLPEAEIANLVRLETDNAGAWQYAVALAHARGDANALDVALSNMADARRADDHVGDEVATWMRFHERHPDLQSSAFDYGDEAPAAPDPLHKALLQTAYRSARTEAALVEACTPDGASENAWKRLGWCVDAGLLLATRGNSFTLRELGVKVLDATGAKPEDIADVQREIDWLAANAATPFRNPAFFGETADNRRADWRDADGDVAATLNRLARLGLPATPPEGWSADRADPADDAYASMAQAWMDYQRSVIDDLKAGTEVADRALGLALARQLRAFGSNSDTEADTTADTVLADLAAANPSNPLVQWIAANQGNAEAIVRVRELEPENLAAWLVVTRDATSAHHDTEILHRAAHARHYDDHQREILARLAAAYERQPMPAEAAELWAVMAEEAGGDPRSTKTMAFVNAAAMAAASAQFAPMARLQGICTSASDGNETLREDCTAVGTLLLEQDASLMIAQFGTSLLRKIDALEGAQLRRARDIAWWLHNDSAVTQDFDRYADDYLASGKEIEALRRVLVRAGKAEPPADWQPPQWKKQKHEALE